MTNASINKPSKIAAAGDSIDDPVIINGEQCITTAALAAHWGYSYNTLKVWRRRKQGPKYHKFHGRVLYRIKDIKAYEKLYFSKGK